ncbi:MAG: hypothetical protein M3R38_21990, partial [Actinomycetota bacterium]|nr:hypothetical protein [Actinomycetota bacterium]
MIESIYGASDADLRVRPGDLEYALELYDRVRTSDHGQTLILAGEPGSGRLETMRAIGELLRSREGAAVIGGSFAPSGEYAPWEQPEAGALESLKRLAPDYTEWAASFAAVAAIAASGGGTAALGLVSALLSLGCKSEVLRRALRPRDVLKTLDALRPELDRVTAG